MHRLGRVLPVEAEARYHVALSDPHLEAALKLPSAHQIWGDSGLSVPVLPSTWFLPLDSLWSCGPRMRAEGTDGFMYRVFALSGMVGAGFSNEVAFQTALAEFKFDLIANDAGSMDPGPAYLGSGAQEYDEVDIVRDLGYLVRLARANDCPLVIGSAGTSGDTPHLRQTQDRLAAVLLEQGLADLKVAVIDSHIDSGDLAARIGRLRPLGRLPLPTPEAVAGSVCVGQMGCGPIITALDAGADIVLAGRACDVSVFAADMIRHGVSPGIAHHVGHVLECGGIALDPPNGADSIIAEIGDDGAAVFISPDPNRKSTVQSIAAHSFYEEGHPALQSYPEGILTLAHTRYFQRTDNVAGFTGSQFVSQPHSLKVEASEMVGRRLISLVPCDANIPLGDGHIVYGIDGVEPWPAVAGEAEIGIVLRVRGKDRADVDAVHSAINVGLKHYDYPHRITTSGNVAFPLSPLKLVRRADDGEFEAISMCGTREPLFIAQFDEITSALRERARRLHPAALAACDVSLDKYTSQNPIALIVSVGEGLGRTQKKHAAAIEALKDHLNLAAEDAILGLDTGSAYRWSVFHILDDEEFIKDKLFKIQMLSWDGSHWQQVSKLDPKFPAFGDADDGSFDLDPRKLMAIAPNTHDHPAEVYRPLLEMANVIRSKDAGAGILTYDIFFKSQADYGQAIGSGLFTPAGMAELFGNAEEDWICCSRVDDCLGIKLTRYRRVPSGSEGTRDTYGAQQQMPIEQIQIPIFS